MDERSAKLREESHDAGPEAPGEETDGGHGAPAEKPAQEGTAEVPSGGSREEVDQGTTKNGEAVARLLGCKRPTTLDHEGGPSPFGSFSI